MKMKTILLVILYINIFSIKLKDDGGNLIINPLGIGELGNPI
jgi:hypothetical protein